MKKLILCVALLAALLTPDVFAKSNEKQIAREVLARYAECLVKKAPEKSRAFVLSGKFIDRRSKSFTALVNPECMKKPVSMTFSDDVLKGALAEVIINVEPDILNRMKFSAVPSLGYEEPTPVETVTKEGKPVPRRSIEAQTKAVAYKTDTIARQRLGECAVRSDTLLSNKLLRTIVGTPAEMAEIKAMQPILAQCIVKGQTVKLDRVIIRSNVASAYFRLASFDGPQESAN